jgi:hypothetical protein
MKRWPRAVDIGVVALLVAVTLGLGLALHPLAVDDAFITYRYAQNLATGHGFVYNPGRPVLSTTAPLYALILAAGSLAWPDVPALANTVSAVALGAAALFLFLLGRREGMPLVGALAALLLAASPLLWLSLGLETAAFLALALGAILAYRGRRLYLASALLALAALTRGDGVVLAAVLGADWLLRRLIQARRASEASPDLATRRALGAAAVYLAALLPVLGWLAWQFRSPLPATLSAKQAQSSLGVTGFYAHTTYLQGLWILVRARLEQTWLYLLFLPALLAGLFALRRAAWVRLVAAWGVAHLAGYSLLGVTPYYWYYAPPVPALACLAALGIVEAGGALKRALRGRPAGKWLAWGAGGLCAAALLGCLLWSDYSMVRALHGPVPPPEDRVSKVLPEAKADVYRQVGEWLRDHTPADATVGVTEVGVIGYYSGRPMVDFLGLLEPDVARALGRGDLTWALLRYQPDYLALTAVSPLYAYDLRADPWFQAAYAPVESFDNARFWGSPVTVYQRQVPRVELGEPAAAGVPANYRDVGIDLGGQIRLLGAAFGTSTVQPGQILPVTLYWQALAPVPHDYAVFVHLLGQYDRVLAQRDAQPGLGAAPTSAWTPGTVVADPYLIALPEAAYAPDVAVWEVGLYDAQTGQRLTAADGADNVRFGAVSVATRSAPLALDFGAITLSGYGLDRLALTPGEALHVTLQWAGFGPVWVTLDLWSESGELAAMAEGGSRGGQDRFTLTLGPTVAPGAYDLELSIRDPEGNLVLPLLGADRRPVSDRVRLTKVRLYP